MKKILVVDDDENIRELVSATLENEHYKIYEAVNGEEAINLAKDKKPALILLDVSMPLKDGFEVCKILKTHQETRSICVIMLTGKTNEDDKRKCGELGANDYITKPFSPLSLIKKVELVLES